jgi:hypothetical protein
VAKSSGDFDPAVAEATYAETFGQGVRFHLRRMKTPEQDSLSPEAIQAGVKELG